MQVDIWGKTRETFVLGVARCEGGWRVAVAVEALAAVAKEPGVGPNLEQAQELPKPHETDLGNKQVQTNVRAVETKRQGRREEMNEL